jgi:uncharacterized membrane protein
MFAVLMLILPKSWLREAFKRAFETGGKMDQPAQPPSFTYHVTVTPHAEDHETFAQRVKHALKTAGIDVLEVMLIPLAVVTGAGQDN